MSVADGNLFADLPVSAPDEIVGLLAAGRGVRIERIVSTGQASPPGFWYDQPQAEWVVLLSGSAVLRFADEPGPRVLNPGDHLVIAPRRRHRIEATDANRATVWLAVHFDADQPSAQDRPSA